MKRRLLLLVCIFLVGCRESEQMDEITDDPFIEAFWNTGIKMMISSYCEPDTCEFSDLNDTTWFDSKGNMVKERISGNILERSFDDKRLLTRFSSDAGDYVYRYEFIDDGAVLKQKTFEFYPRDSSSFLYSISLIKLNKNGGVLDEADSLGRLLVRNLYDDQQRVVKKVNFDLKGAVQSYWVYKYELNALSSVEYFEPPIKIVYQYRKGLLHSSIRTLDGEAHVQKTKYQLIFADK
jgi:hypothetical protein